MAAMLKVQDGCHNEYGGSDFYQKLKVKAMDSMRAEIGTFVHNDHIHIKFGVKCLTKISMCRKKEEEHQVGDNGSWSMKLYSLCLSSKVQSWKFMAT